MKKILFEISIKKIEEKKIKFSNNNENTIYEKENQKIRIRKRINYNKRNNYFLILNNKHAYNFNIIIFFLYIYFPLLLSKNTKLKKLEYMSEITITINGTGTQKILSHFNGYIQEKNWDYNFNSLPDEIYINGVQTSIGKEVSSLTEIRNNITMIWNYDIAN